MKDIHGFDLYYFNIPGNKDVNKEKFNELLYSIEKAIKYMLFGDKKVDKYVKKTDKKDIYIYKLDEFSKIKVFLNNNEKNYLIPRIVIDITLFRIFPIGFYTILFKGLNNIFKDELEVIYVPNKRFEDLIKQNKEAYSTIFKNNNYLKLETLLSSVKRFVEDEDFKGVFIHFKEKDKKNSAKGELLFKHQDIRYSFYYNIFSFYKQTEYLSKIFDGIEEIKEKQKITNDISYIGSLEFTKKIIDTNLKNSVTTNSKLKQLISLYLI